MKKSIYCLSIYLVLFLVGIQHQLSSTNTEALLVWSKVSHDFGQIQKDEVVSTEFFFQNTGTKALMILSVKASCGCTVTDYTKGEILPGGMGKVSATYNAAKIGAFNKTLRVTANTGDEAIQLWIKGEVIE